MTVAFRSDAEVTNGTAGTSVTVSRPSGTAAGDVLVAVVGCTTTATISTPSGWTLIGTQAASTNVRTSAYYRVADGTEPASWTWTLGSSQRSWGWVGAYTDVDTTDPIYDWAGTPDTSTGTTFAPDIVSIPNGGVGVGAVGGVRTATGTAVTWSMDPEAALEQIDERADLSTNAGSGTDVAAVVADGVYTGGGVWVYSPTLLSSLALTHAAMILVTLRPVFVGYTGGRVGRTVEAAFGADPDGDPDDWAWTDITSVVRADPGITITKGLPPNSDAAMAPPTSVTFEVNNPDGDWTPDNPLGSNWPNITQDLPIRVTNPYGFVTPTERATVFAESFTPSWDPSTRVSVVRVQAYGRLQRILSAAAPLESPLRRQLSRRTPSTLAPSEWYWPLEDASGARWAASGLPQQPAMASGDVTFASATDCPGSGPLPVLGDGGMIRGYGATTFGTRWSALCVVKLPETPPAATVELLSVMTTSLRWWLEIQPGSPDAIALRARSVHDQTSVLNDSVTITESLVYGEWTVLAISAVQAGLNVSYTGTIFHAGGAGVGVSGSLSSQSIGRPTYLGFAANADSAGVAVGHLVLYTNALFDTDDDPHTIKLLALEGNAGDVPWERAEHLCNSAGIPFDADVGTGTTTVLMGPETASTLPAALEEAAATDQGLLHDGGTDGALWLLTRLGRYNRSVALTLDVAQGQLPREGQPEANTRDRVTDSTVSRAGGSSARYVDTTLPGRQEAPQFSLEDDARLESIAGFRVNLSTTPGMRYPTLPLNLRRNPELVEDWVHCRIGSRVQVVNLWESHGPDTVDQHIMGWTEHISSDRWTVTLHCTPAQRLDVPVLEATDDSVFRLDLAATELDSGVDADDTALSVTSAAALLSTDSDDYPVDLDVGGERVTATACSGASNPQTVTVTRHAHARSHDAGTSVVVWRGRGIAL